MLAGEPVRAGHLGAELGAPADPSLPYAAARPEWYFLFLFQFLKVFEGWGATGEFLGAIVVPGLIMGVMFLMPILGSWKLGHRFNVAFTLGGPRRARPAHGAGPQRRLLRPVGRQGPARRGAEALRRDRRRPGEARRGARQRRGEDRRRWRSSGEKLEKIRHSQAFLDAARSRRRSTRRGRSNSPAAPSGFRPPACSNSCGAIPRARGRGSSPSTARAATPTSTRCRPAAGGGAREVVGGQPLRVRHGRAGCAACSIPSRSPARPTSATRPTRTATW